MFNHKEYNRAWSKNNKDKRAISRRKWREKNADYLKKYYTERRKSPKYKFYRYKTRANKNKLQFSLSLVQFEEIINMPCYYCGKLPLNGIDRINNKKGYIMENCISCCWPCNKFKGSLKQYEFIEFCRKISKHLS